MILEEIVKKKRNRLDKVNINKYVDNKKQIYNDNLFKKTLLNNDFTIIGEYKKASPSKGMLIEDFKIRSILESYEKLPIGAYSVLTEEDYFLGNNEYLKYISSNSERPTLRKDFVIDKYQIYEAKELGASSILLIVALLKDSLREYYDLAMDIGLAPLVEVHTKEELNIALKANVEIIGINNRNLKNFQVNLNTTKELLKYIPSNKIVISESGIKTIEDIKYLKNLGVKGILIGEGLIKNMSNKDFIKELKDLIL